MRKFKVGDRVKFEGGKDGYPRWNYDTDWGGDGVFYVQTVIDVADTDNLFCVRKHVCNRDDWWWPQPDRPDARYGAPGYLELVEAVEERNEPDETKE